MPDYIDKLYYRDEYKGIDTDDTTLERAISRASQLIDQMTNYKIELQGGLITFDTFDQNRIKSATAAQTEYFVINGEETHNTGDTGDGDSFTLGKLKVDSKNQSDSNLSRKERRVSPQALEELKQTGLLYRGTLSVSREVFSNA